MKIIEENNNLIRFNDLSVKLNERSSFRVENLVINEGLRRLQQEGKIMETGDSHRRTIRKLLLYNKIGKLDEFEVVYFVYFVYFVYMSVLIIYTFENI